MMSFSLIVGLILINFEDVTYPLQIRMRLSKYYLPTLKEVPADAAIISHQYCLRAGLIKQTASGIYTWLPLGLKVLDNIMTIIREEMDKSGALEVLMPSIQPAELWKESGRYDDYGLEMLRIQDRHQREMLFGPTHEEVVTDVVRGVLNSYRDFPVCLYQIQWKFRDELRPRFGVMRGREFLMKDAYSFDQNSEDATKSYFTMYLTYMKIFRKMGLMPLAVKADTGAIGGDLSHEFHVLANTGESTLYYDSKFEDVVDSEDLSELAKMYTAADDKHDPNTCSVAPEDLRISKGIEIGHIFYFGDKYSSKMQASFHDRDGQNKCIHMGAYGIGVSRLVGAIIEVFHDGRGIVWPEAIAPFRVGLINLHSKDEECHNQCEYIYNQLPPDSVLYDDSDETAGIKFSRMDLIGLPWQIIVGKKFISEGLVELKNRATGNKEIMTVEQVAGMFTQ